MKKWVLPEIRIDGFRANEYISTCESHGFTPLSDQKKYSADFGHYTNGGYSWHAHDPNGRWDGSIEEWYGNFDVNNNSSVRGWYNNIHVYERQTTTTPNDEPYSNETYFKDLGLFDVYQTNTRTWIYKNGESPYDQGDPDPTTGKYYS